MDNGSSGSDDDDELYDGFNDALVSVSRPHSHVVSASQSHLHLHAQWSAIEYEVINFA